MPNIMKYFFDISFSQDKYIYNEFEDKLLFIFSKFVAANDTNITEGITGLCAALSSEYLTHVRQGGLEQGKNYLASIKYLTKILDEQISPHDPPLFKAMLQARKIHAQEKFNRLLIDLAKRQRESFDMMDMASYYPAYPFWPHKDLSETISNYMEKVISYESEMQSLRKDRYWFKELFVEITRQLDNENYNTEEIKFFAENTFISLKKKYIEKYIKYYNDRGLKTINNSQRYIYNEINIDEFIKKNIDIDDIDKNKYYEFCSVDHMMAIVIEKNSKTGKLIYAFFDPNNGVIQIENKDIFIEFLNYIVKTRQDAYNFIQLRDGNVDVFISEMEYDEQITEQAILPKLDENLVNITINKILCENEYTFILDVKIKIIFKQFNGNTRTTLIELISEKHKPQSINILMDSLSADEILIFFTNQHKNILALSDNNLHIRITNKNYQIRKIINGSEIIYRLPNSRELLEFYLSDPIANLSREQLPVELFELHNNEVLGDIAPRKFDNWWDPRVNPELIPQQNKMELVKPQLAQANNVYNVIIQLEGEEIINKAAANLIGKHPNNTILIQYDLQNDQYRLVYGDIDKVITNNSRWLLIGHGRFDEQKKQRVFANQSAYTIVDKLKN